MANKPGLHGRDHRPGGADPIPELTAVLTSGRFTAILFAATEAVTPDAGFDETCFSFTLPSDLDRLGVTDVEAFVQTPSTSGSVEIDVFRRWDDLAGSAQSVFVTDLTIDQNDYTSLTAAVPAVLSSPNFNAGDYIVVQVVDEGTGTLGLGVHLTFGTV